MYPQFTISVGYNVVVHHHDETIVSLKDQVANDFAMLVTHFVEVQDKNGQKGSQEEVRPYNMLTHMFTLK